MKVRQISIFLENRSGRLAGVLRAVANSGVNIRALSLADTSDFGILRLIVDDVDRCVNGLRDDWNIDFDDAGAIGRRYRRQDEIGTPFCVTVDFDSLDDDAVTVRERDTMEQARVPRAELHAYLAERLRGS